VASAFDHHDGDLDVQQRIYLVNNNGTSLSTPELKSALDYDIRSEWVVKYDASDRSGNEAEQIVFAIILDDVTPPEIVSTLTFPLTLESCDMDNQHQSHAAFQDWILPLNTIVTDNVDGNLGPALEIEVTSPGGGTSTGSTYLQGGGEPVIVDTHELGTWTITFRSHDYAGMFGLDGKDNTADLVAQVVVVDVTAPEIYCDPSTYNTTRGSFAAGEGVEVGHLTVQECSEACFHNQWSQQTGTVTKPVRCVYFQCDVGDTHTAAGDPSTGLCSLYPTGAAADFGNTGTAVQGRLAQCGDAVQTHECALHAEPPLPYEDAGAVCIDMRDSLFQNAYRKDALSVTAAPLVSGATVGDFHIVYSCSDSSGNDAATKTRQIKVQDTVAPVVEIVDHAIELQLASTDPEIISIITHLVTPAVAINCSDACTGDCIANCAAIVFAEDCSAADEHALLPADIENPGTYGIKYSCTDASGNVATTCRTVITIDTTTPVPTKAPTGYPTPFPTPYPSAHCQVTEWKPWETCSEPCGGGVRQRFREIVSSAANGGDECPDLTQIENCNTHNCPINCVFDLQPWTECTVSCGGGTQIELVNISQYALYDGTACPAAQQRVCNEHECPRDCVRTWNAWGDCSVSCAAGTQTRSADVTTTHAYGGVECPADQTRACETQACPVDCVVSQWTAWGECTQQCGGGVQSRSRTITTEAEDYGKVCPQLSETVACGTEPCPVDCEFTWEEWSACTETCGVNGAQHRDAVVTVVSAHEGTVCPNGQDQVCNRYACPINCQVSEWGTCTEGVCSVTCGDGTCQRARTVAVDVGYGGVECPALVDTIACKLRECPIHCEVSGWSGWDSCTKTCDDGGGSGTHERTRDIVTYAEHLGQACPVTVDTQPCNTGVCPTTCIVSAWSAFGLCSSICNGGLRMRSRQILTPPQNGAASCPPITQTEACHTHQCPVNCQVTSWDEYGECTHSCGYGSQSHTRTIVVDSAYLGTACPALEESAPCYIVRCPRDCAMAAWQAWGICDKACGGGVETRVREITESSGYGGVLCGGLEQTRECNSHPCPVFCQVSGWSPYGACSVSCGGGLHTADRVVTQQPQYDAPSCPALSDTATCNSFNCPVDCAMAEWEAWGLCDSECGFGTATRFRAITQEAAYGGAACPSVFDTKHCNTHSCDTCEGVAAVACLTSDWGNPGWSEEWTMCTNACGGGNQYRTRYVTQSSLCGGEQCGALYEHRACNTHTCPIDCVVAEWDAWSQCSKTCGGEGLQTHSRTVLIPPSSGGTACGSTTGSLSCNAHIYCPIDCDVSDWSSWGMCSLVCNTGQMARSRTVVVASNNYGATCELLSEYTGCNFLPCPVDCKVSLWGGWGVCSEDCDGGEQHRQRGVLVTPAHGGVPCPTVVETQICNNHYCPVDCEVSEWGNLDAHCSASCGGGYATRLRSITKTPGFGGIACPSLVDPVPCNEHDCPVDCEVTQWGNFSICSRLCDSGTGPGLTYRMRYITVTPLNGGSVCPALAETYTCGSQLCANNGTQQDCEFTDWEPAGICSAACDGGTKTRYRHITAAAAFGGADCPTLIDTQACNEQPCTQPCEMSVWSGWSVCDTTCGGGKQHRSRTVATEPVGDTPACPHTAEDTACSEQSCPVDCVVSGWDAYGLCDAACGTGNMTRARVITTQVEHAGKPCPSLVAIAACNTQACPVHCALSHWADWTACDKTCGGGETHRERTISTAPEHGGAACPETFESMDCNTDDCPQDCVVSNWTEWSVCSAHCGSGQQSQYRDIVTPAANGADPCPVLYRHLTCNTQACEACAPENKTDCTVSAWGDFGECSYSCSGGTRARTRAITAPAHCGGVHCPSLYETDHCNQQPCPIDCEVSGWGSWGLCSVVCDSGLSTRVRVRTVSAHYGGAACPPVVETVACNTQACPVNCAVNEWTEWSTCSKTCGGGVATRSRTVHTASGYGGVGCPPLADSAVCNAPRCPVDCLVSEWSSWGLCTDRCAIPTTTATKTRTRLVLTPTSHGGVDCGVLAEHQDCPPVTGCVCNSETEGVTCEVSAFGSWGLCTRMCAGGKQHRFRTVVQSAYCAEWSSGCPSLVDDRDCNTQPCPIDCDVELWLGWSTCSASCNSGVMSRTRAVKTDPEHGGYPCPPLSEADSCNGHHCPIDCAVSEWSQLDICSVGCGTGGIRTKSRQITRSAGFGGKPCPALTDDQECNTHECAVHCGVTDWQAWPDCSLSCGHGLQTRARTVLTLPQYGGAACPTLAETRSCNEQPCPIDCEVSDWNAWGKCSNECGGGTKIRIRDVLIPPPRHEGKACPNLVDSAACHTADCAPDPPVDCVVSEWTNFGLCDQECALALPDGAPDGGSKMRSRYVIESAANGGVPCPDLTENEQCNLHACPQDCAVATWSIWGECSTLCRTPGAPIGTHMRTRTIQVQALYGGDACPQLSEYEDCGDVPCEQNCEVSSWVEYTSCSVSCGSGTQDRTREVLVASLHGGKRCPALNGSAVCNTHRCPVDCAVSDWGGWGICDKLCGLGGKATRVREVTSSAAFGGIACPGLVESKACNEYTCPVACLLSEWGHWGACSATCDGGEMSSTRTITQTADYGGSACGELARTSCCNVGPCPQDCVVSAWGSWGVCNEQCGTTGEKTRTRMVTRHAAHAGSEPCPVLFEKLPCNRLSCAVDCLVSQWEEWADCTASCGGGSKTRLRSVERPQAHEGQPCPTLIQTAACNTNACPVDCVLSTWSDWAACSVECGGGTRHRTRSTITPAGGAEGGELCGHKMEYMSCNQADCPTCSGQPRVNCAVSNWGSWDTCSVVCGGGVQLRSRGVTTAYKCGGDACPGQVEERPCNTAVCPTHCEMSDWGEWGACSASCGGGISARSRVVLAHAADGGVPCAGSADAATTESTACGGGACPMDCEVEQWGTWTGCSRSCGGGTREAMRVVLIPASDGGQPCPRLERVGNCNTAACPVDCLLSNWSSWTDCSAVCAGGSQSRHRCVRRPAADGGEACADILGTQSCNQQACPTAAPTKAPTGAPTGAPTTSPTESPTKRPVDCEFSEWTAFEACSKTCGGGEQHRHRHIETGAAHGGAQCVGEDEDERACNTQSCPVDCEVEVYSAWSDCTVTCGGGTMSSSRTISTQPANGGLPCPALSRSDDCSQANCPVDCELSPYGNPSGCTAACGGGYSERIRTVVTPAAHEGLACGGLVETSACNTGVCPPCTDVPPVHCATSDWTDWGSCSHVCGGGEQLRSRTVTASSSCGGDGCGPLHAQRACNTAACPVNCTTSEWSDFGICTTTCGGGNQTRTRDVTVQPLHGGDACGVLVQWEPCNTFSCRVDCHVSEWTQWTPCSGVCGDGSRTRSRSVVVAAADGGAACPPLEETDTCDLNPCPIDCVLSGWGNWGVCTKECGGGESSRFRTVAVASGYGGDSCGVLAEQSDCNTADCPVDCEVNAWDPWGLCAAACAGGERHRYRTITVEQANNGTACPALHESQVCNAQFCPVDCVVSAWTNAATCTVTCGGGTEMKTRDIVTGSGYGGLVCPALTDYPSCNSQHCPVDCEVSDWGSWGVCTKYCGSGERIRTRSVLAVAEYGGLGCPPLNQLGACNPQTCAPCNAGDEKDCELSDWGEWSQCTLNCGTGSRQHTRAVVAPSHCGGSCDVLFELGDCNTHYCMVECEVSGWADWGACSVTCSVDSAAVGSKSRSRSVVQQPLHGANPCPALAESAACGDNRCPINCEVSEWGEFGLCTVACETGTKTRVRLVVIQSQHGGTGCPPVVSTADCNTHFCAVNCELGLWSAYSDCSLTCGTGQHTRTRDMITPPLYGGTACGATAEAADCNTQNCPVDCQVSAWASWSVCSLVCGGGSRTQTRAVTSTAAHGGVPCPVLTNTTACNTQACPPCAADGSDRHDCSVAEWGAWSACTLSCGTGSVARVRELISAPRCGGTACPGMTEFGTCNTQECPVTCEVSAWSSWGGCTKLCGGGWKHRTREVTQSSGFGGQLCPTLTQELVCNTLPCAINCVVSEWAEWSACTLSCGTGSQTRGRNVTVPAEHEGLACPRLSEEDSCNRHDCPVDCATSNWGYWGLCDAECNGGNKTRTRLVTRSQGYGGIECAALSETAVCNTVRCPVDCAVSEWTGWSECDKTCGGGTNSQTRSVIVEVQHGGEACPALSATASCNIDGCAGDCEVSEWSQWSLCTTVCDGGDQTRSRAVTVSATHGGVACPVLSQTQPCNAQACAPCHYSTDHKDCTVSDWSGWGECDIACGNGTATRSRVVTQSQFCQGAACPTLDDTQGCNTHACPIDCEISDFGAWGACSDSCGGGTRVHVRTALVTPQYGGTECPPLEESEECNVGCCPLDCALAEWGQWGLCSKVCPDGYNGTSTRFRIITQTPACGGVVCAALYDGMPCNTHPCPIHCEVSGWAGWSDCTKTCGGGGTSRTRGVSVAAQYSGDECPHLAESDSCNTANCALDCVFSEWGVWGVCSVLCDGGTSTQHRTIISPSAYGGSPCPAMNATQACNTQGCPVNCAVDVWSGWSDCSASCGPAGLSRRSRPVLTPPANGGTQCPYLNATTSCNQQNCPRDCEVSGWGDWDTCPHSCGGYALRWRSRSITVEPAAGGKPCPTQQDSKECPGHMAACPEDCIVSTFSSWAACPVTCGNGTHTRARIVERPVANGGVVCPHLEETKPCNPQHCAIDCEVSAWGPWGECPLTCGTASQTRTRTIVEATPQYGGRSCPFLSSEQQCVNDHCPVDCVVGVYGDWGGCTRACGGGTQIRVREPSTIAAHGGKECPTLTDTRPCSTQDCETPQNVDCVMAEWETWSQCTHACCVENTECLGEQQRTRDIATPQENDGAPCPAVLDTRSCNHQRCAIECRLSEYGAWGLCTKLCNDGSGPGSQIRVRAIEQTPKYGADLCEGLWEEQACNTGTCDVNCEVSLWTEWSVCTTSCGGGTQTADRVVEVQPVANGLPCPALHQSTECEKQGCPVDCVVSGWSDWGLCNSIAGGGTRTRTRTVQVSSYMGKACPSLVESAECNTQPCAVDCKVSEWSGYSVCDKTCGSGSQINTRNVSQPQLLGGLPCPTLEIVSDCNLLSCPVDCFVSEWGEFGMCDRMCGGGQMQRKRTVYTPAEHRGTGCPALVEHSSCNSEACPACAEDGSDLLHCTVSAWTDLGCTHACMRDHAAPSRTFTRSVEQPSHCGGTACPTLTNLTVCNTDPCKVDCQLSDWRPWSACSLTCNDGNSSGGVMSQTRLILVTPAYGGVGCTNTRSTLACNDNVACPVDCQVSEWGEWGLCTEACKPDDRVAGYKVLTRSVAVSAGCGGMACPDLSESEPCNDFPCPQDCQVAGWGEWGVCSHLCGGGDSSRVRQVLQHVDYGGTSCPHLYETQVCNNAICPVDCLVSGWGEPGLCTKTCGTGKALLTREITRSAGYGGQACPALLWYADCSAFECPVDCTVSEWSNWGICTKYCESGDQARTRTIQQYPLYGGEVCGPLVGNQDCNTHACPPCAEDGSDKTDCLTTEWTEWTQCTATCSGGESERSREVVIQPRCGGSVCGALRSNKMPCNEDPCPIPCELGVWGDWSDCSSSCTAHGAGGGLEYGSQMRTRSLVVDAQYGADPCGSLTSTQMCNVNDCPVDCDVSEWSTNGDCDKACGTGEKQRSRYVVVQTAFGGNSCPPLHQTEACNTNLCPINCVVSDWGLHGDCSLSCGGGTRTRTREVVTPPQHDGLACLPTIQTEPCQTHPCAIDCVMSVWGDWGVCTLNCGSGVRYRSRTIESPAEHYGEPCGTANQEQTCNADPCPPCEANSAVHCNMTVYSAWGECTKSCNSGTKTRTREIVSPSSCGGTGCGHTVEYATCNRNECPVDCVMQSWGIWTQCTHGCKCHEPGAQEGVRMRSRLVSQPSDHGGVACGAATQSEVCNTHPCPVDCQLSLWELSGVCSKSCGAGVQTMKRTVTKHPLFGGTECGGSLVYAEQCNTQACPEDCLVSDWSDWGHCDAVCGGGVNTRTRTIIHGVDKDGKACPLLSESRACNTACCRVDCVVSPWSSSNPCSTSCGSGTVAMTRTVVTDASCAGISCPTLSATVTCNRQRCPVDCATSAWASWGSCGSVCSGQGHKVRERSVANAAEHGGASCGSLAETMPCTAADPHGAADEQSCVVSSWTSWGNCDAACGGGSQERTRLVTSPHNCGGTPCPALSASQACNTQPCPADCVVSGWFAWSECSATCGSTGTQSRVRTVETAAADGGFGCPELEETLRCNERPCPIDCAVSEWTGWGACSRACKTPTVHGTSTRTRRVLAQSEHGGANCTELVKEMPCAMDSDAFLCPDDCLVSQWGAWSNCTEPCGTGATTRARDVLQPAAGGGNQCPPVSESAPCNIMRCPTDCVLSAWSNWDTCTVAYCGGGSQIRTRDVLIPTNNGCNCGALMENRTCNEQACPVHCTVTDWSAWTACSEDCGLALQTRTRQIDQAPEGSGRECPSMEDHQTCENKKCPVHCLNEFMPWSACSKSCGSGVQSREVIVIQASLYGGDSCPETEHRHCNSFPCTTEPPTATASPSAAPTVEPTLAPTVHNELPQPVLTIEGDQLLTVEANLDTFYEDAGASCLEYEGTSATQVDHVTAQAAHTPSTGTTPTDGLFPDHATTGLYQIVFGCQGRYGRLAEPNSRFITVQDTTCPVCDMSSADAPSVVEASFPYTDPGVSCTDSMGNVTVVTDNQVNVEQVGVYTVTYRARDASGNWNDDAHCTGGPGSNTYVRTVTVKDSLKPVMNLYYKDHGGVSRHVQGPKHEDMVEAAASAAYVMMEEQPGATGKTSLRSNVTLAAGLLMAGAGALLLWRERRRSSDGGSAGGGRSSRRQARGYTEVPSAPTARRESGMERGMPFV
jgi:hypothetical protein